MQSDFDEKLRRYAHLLIEHGLNVQPGQIINVSGEAIHREFAYLLCKEAYARGAKHVVLDLIEPRLQRERLLNAAPETLSYVPPFQKVKVNTIVDEGGGTVKILGSEYPLILNDVDPKKVNAELKALSQELKYFREEGIGKSRIHWTLGAAATPQWGKRVFPELDEDEAYAALWESIFKIVRVDRDDYMQVWHDHNAKLQERSRALTALKIKKLHFQGPGTDLEVYLSDRALFRGGSERGPHGKDFEPNIPTEECFTTPDCRGTTGHVAVTRPVLINGKLVVGLKLEFKDGAIVKFSAEEGEDTFREYSSTDAGARYLGEVAFVGIDSPVYQSGRVFELILFDENAACHIAIGMAYKFCIEGGTKMNELELAAIGCNHSLVHTDMMISSDEVDVHAESFDGRRVTLMERGSWAL